MLIGACNRRIDHDRWDLILLRKKHTPREPFGDQADRKTRRRKGNEVRNIEKLVRIVLVISITNPLDALQQGVQGKPPVVRVRNSGWKENDARGEPKHGYGKIEKYIPNREDMGDQRIGNSKRKTKINCCSDREHDPWPVARRKIS